MYRFSWTPKLKKGDLITGWLGLRMPKIPFPRPSILKNSWWKMPLNTHTEDHLWRSVSQTPFSKILYPPWNFKPWKGINSEATDAHIGCKFTANLSWGRCLLLLLHTRSAHHVRRGLNDACAQGLTLRGYYGNAD